MYVVRKGLKRRKNLLQKGGCETSDGNRVVLAAFWLGYLSLPGPGRNPHQIITDEEGRLGEGRQIRPVGVFIFQTFKRLLREGTFGRPTAQGSSDEAILLPPIPSPHIGRSATCRMAPGAVRRSGEIPWMPPKLPPNAPNGPEIPSVRAPEVSPQVQVRFPSSSLQDLLI